MKLFTKIINSIGPSFLRGLDRFYSYLIKANLQSFLQCLDQFILSDKTLLGVLNSLKDDDLLSSHQYYIKHTNKFSKKQLSKFLHWIFDIGRLQILRREISFELNKNCKFHSKNLEAAVRTMNEYEYYCFIVAACLCS